MAKYRLTERACIIDRVYDAGTEIGEGTAVPFAGIPGPHMEPLDKDAETRLAKAKADAERAGRMFDLNIMNSVPIERIDSRTV